MECYHFNVKLNIKVYAHMFLKQKAVKGDNLTETNCVDANHANAASTLTDTNSRKALQMK